MLGGSDLMSAYQPLSTNDYSPLSDEFDDNFAPKMQQQQPQPQQTQQQPIKQDSQNQAKKYDEADQRLKVLMAQLQEKKERYISSQASNPPQVIAPQQSQESSSYFDKLFSKRKEIYKVLQLSLIITLGLSIHFLIDHYLTKYLADNEMSFERQLILRLMYPLAVLFILWNLRVFVK